MSHSVELVSDCCTGTFLLEVTSFRVQPLGKYIKHVAYHALTSLSAAVGESLLGANTMAVSLGAA